MGNLKIVLIIHSENVTEIKLTTYSMIFFFFWENREEAQQCYCEAANCFGWMGQKPSSTEDEKVEPVQIKRKLPQFERPKNTRASKKRVRFS